ncbi:MAG: hypothetical protein KAW00_03145, partial [Dehalococcoidia bacterium]|nr:hypothetical protein [Dehalococcoidia bacterium]
MSNVKKSFGILVSLLLVLAFIPSVLSPPSVSAQDPFASEVVGYSADLDGSGDYNNPQDVLGEPAKENPDGTCVSMVCPAWGEGRITTINEGSYIVVKFDHQVADDPDNPFGIDFIVFGNSMYGGEGWVEPGTNMEEHHITGGTSAEPVLVAVSQDGENWYNYTDGPYGDTEFPTNVYEWDRENDQWGDQLDFTKPVDPSIDSAKFGNMSVADVIDTYYNGSAGGTGFDLAPSGFAWIQYIKVYGDANHKGGEIDAFADVSPVSVYVRVEGQNETIWSGNVTVSESTITDDEGNSHYLADPTALGALDEASQIGSFPYTVYYYDGLGLCILSISGEGDWTNGPWWQYRVDDYLAEVGANSFILNVTSPPGPPHSEMLFYSSTTFSETPLKIALNKTEVDVGKEFAVTVNAYNDTTHNWLPCANATVHADQDYVTSPEGTVDISISRDGSFKVFAEKSGYIRSDKVLVKVGTGEGTQGQVSLSANVVPAISI